ncbi:sensor histidine kinase [Flavobacterium sp.]|uniref:sensor histidine kinase n=1 Tax=Flavobacterium sp. TaxID=239 RepID=UPI0025F6061B|nr:sensor histidine kinase [Flavobacterium sp.]
MNKSIVFLTIITILFGCSQMETQPESNPTNDSVQKYLALAENDSLDFKKRVQYNDKALSFIDLRRNDSLTIKNLYNISFKCHLFNQTKLLKKTADLILKKSEKVNDSSGLGYANRCLGLYYMSISENEKAIEHLFTAKKIFNSLKNKNYTNRVTLDILLTQSYACDYLGSNKTAFELLKSYETKNDKRIKYFCFNIIANNLSGLKLHLKAIQYYLKAEKNSLSESQKYTIYNNVSHEYINLKKHQNAAEYLMKIISSKKNKDKFPNEYAIAESLFALNEIESRKNIKVLELLMDADSILSSTNSMNGYNYNLLNISKLYSIKGDSTKAIYYAKKAVKISEDYKNPTDILLSLSQLIKIDRNNVSKNALKYIAVSDSLQLKERNFRDKFAQMQFETEEINQQRETALKQRTLFLIITVAVLFIALLIFVIARQRLKQKELVLRNTQQKANEEIYQLMLVQKTKEDEARQQEKKRIAMELHDGVMNKLTSTRLNLSILSFKRDPATIAHCLPHIEEIKTIENEIRNLTHNLNQKTVIGDDSFEKLVTDLILELNQISRVAFELVVDPAVNWENTTDVQKMNLYRILQESCQNINKHSEAQKAYIRFFLDGDKLCLTVTDDGIGIPPSNPKKGIGLKNIKSRVKALNGKLNINSKVNQGTTLSIGIPLKN